MSTTNLDTGWGANIPDLTSEEASAFEQDALTQAAIEEIQMNSDSSYVPSDNAIDVVVDKYGLGSELQTIVSNSGGTYIDPDTRSATLAAAATSSTDSSSTTASTVDTGITGISGTVSTDPATYGEIILDNSAVTPSNIPEQYKELGYIPVGIMDAMGSKIYLDGTYAGEQDVTVASGSTISLDLEKTTSKITSDGGSLAAQGPSDATIVGSYDNLNLSGLGLQSQVNASVSGNVVLDDVYGTVGLTTTGSNAQIISEDTDLSVNGNGGVLDADGNTLTASGTFNSFRINGVSNANISLGLTGNGMITDSTGTIGATLEGSDANFTIDGAGYDYLTAGQGSITLNNEASANITGVNSNGGDLFINANGGQINYQAQTDVNATINLGNGNAYLTYGEGYTATEVNMADNTMADITGFAPSNGELLATNLKSLTDVSVSYKDNNAYVSESGSSGSIVLHDVAQGGVDILTSLNGTNFTQEYGANTVMIALNDKAAA